MVLVDEAHSMGFIGEHGRGVAEAQGVIDDVDFIIGTFSKSVGTVGGFCVSNHPKFEILRLVCRPYVFTASLPPSVVATAATSIRKLMDSADKRAHLWENSKRLHAGLRQLGFTLGTDEPQSAIIAVIMPDLEKGAAMWEALLERGALRQSRSAAGDARRHDPAALLALRAPQRGPGRRNSRHVRCGRPCNRLHKLSESQGTFGFRQMVNGARLSSMIGDGEELRFDWRRGGAAAAGLFAALVLVVMVFLVAFANDSREQRARRRAASL